MSMRVFRPYDDHGHDCHVCGARIVVVLRCIAPRVGQRRPSQCPECDAPIRRVAHPIPREAFHLILMMYGLPAQADDSLHLPQYVMFKRVAHEDHTKRWVDTMLAVDVPGELDVMLANDAPGPERPEEQQLYHAIDERLRAHLGLGLLEWRIRDLGDRVDAMLAAERDYHLHIREARQRTSGTGGSPPVLG